MGNLELENGCRKTVVCITYIAVSLRASHPGTLSILLKNVCKEILFRTKP